MPRWQKVTLITCAAICGLLLLSMLIVPWQLKKQGSAWIAENTERTLTIEKAFFNPLTLTIEINGIKLTEPRSDLTFAFLERMKLSASLRSLIDFAVILDQVELDSPYVNIELLGKQQFNFSDFTRIGANKPKPAQNAPSKPLLFSLNNIVIRNGQVDFTDQTSPRPSSHQIRELDLSIPFIGNVPYLTDEYVEPSLRMLLNGSEVSATGQLKPFDKSLETSLSLVLYDIDLAFYADRSPVPLPVDIETGVFDTEIDLSYRVSKTAEPQLLLSGILSLSDLDIRTLDKKELFRLPALFLNLDSSEPLRKEINLSSLDLDRPELFIDRDPQGGWNFQNLLAKSTPPTPIEQKQETAPAKLPHIKIAAVTLNDGAVHFNDQQPPAGFTEDVEKINLKLDNFSTLANEQTSLLFSLATLRKVSAKVTGELTVDPPSADLKLAVEKLPLQPYYPYLSEFLNAPLGGSLDLAGQLSYTADKNIRLQQGSLDLTKLEIPFTGQDRFDLAALQLSGVSYDLHQQQLALAKIKLAGGQLQASRLQDGRLSPQLLLKPQPVSQPQEKPAQSAPGLAVRVDDFELDNFDLRLQDDSLPRKPHLNVTALAVHLANLNWPESQQSPFSISAGIGKKGKLKLTGKVAHSPLRLQATTDLKALPLADFNDFLPDNLNLNIRGGRLYSKLAVKIAEQPDRLTGGFQGDLGIANFDLRDPLGEGELLTWDTLNLNGINGEIAPFKLHIKNVALSNYLTKILINKAGKVNLASIAASRETAPPGTVVQAAPPVEVGPPPEIAIDALTLQGGTVTFSDHSMPQSFTTTMYKLGGRITGMSSSEQMRADVDLRGELENHSPLTVTGKLNPLSKDLYADLVINFKDIDLTPLTPYSGTYLGYAIEKGKLYLDLNYLIEKNAIKADNKVLIDQFTLGNPVKSDQATSLPIGLAIALLKDNSGEINLDIPVSGNLADPNFSVVGVVFTVIKNLVVKAATSPLSLLTSMLGSGNEDFSSIRFAPGLATLDAQQLEKLNKLAQMLAKRASLNLEISAFADRKLDPEAYRQEQLRQKLLEVKWLELKDKGTAPKSRADLTITPEEYPDLLKTVYKEATFPRPRNFIGMLKSLPDEEMKKLLLANILAGDNQLAELAKERALVVRNALEKADESIKNRLFLVSSDIFQPPKDGPASRVEFNISAK